MSDQTVEMAHFGITKDDQIYALMEQAKRKDQIIILYQRYLEIEKNRIKKRINMRNFLTLILKCIRKKRFA